MMGQGQTGVSSGALNLEDDRHCFGCGEKNPIGLRLRFTKTEEGVEAQYMPVKDHQGYRDLLHGGIMSLVLDEAMVNAVWLAGMPAVSVEITVRLKHAAKIGEPLRIRAWIVAAQKRLVTTRAEARDASGRVVAEAEAKCLKTAAAASTVGA
ncbi:MAG: PaaI family thioesterase [Candidatus Omnitrophica bacterium]|nr:PaaI family thioesterase [Candidatus Omnitrophota bacterium]